MSKPSERAERAAVRVEITHLIAAWGRVQKGGPTREAGELSVSEGAALVVDPIAWGAMTPAGLRRVFAVILDECAREDLEPLTAAIQAERQVMRECGCEVAA